jgi:hypothetical protein
LGELGPDGGEGVFIVFARELAALAESFGYGTTNNNGNVLSQTIAQPEFSATQMYTSEAYHRIHKVREGTEFQDFAYKEPGNLYVPSWSTGAGWAPGSFAPASPSWFNAENRLVKPQPGITDGAAGNLTAIGGHIPLRRREPAGAGHAEQRDGDVRIGRRRMAGEEGAGGDGR